MPAETPIHPFPGLRPFEIGEQDLFFGREGQSEELVKRLDHGRLLTVVGVSGSGKSSLIFAGLLPYLFGGFLAGAGSHWRAAVCRPAGDPIGNMARALNASTVLGKPNATPQEEADSEVRLEVRLRRSGLGLIETVRLAGLPEAERLLIIVDQFEELFRYADAGDRERDKDAIAFVKLLLEATRQHEVPIYIVLTMRSDFIGDCARFRDLPEAVASALYLIPRMTREEKRAAIEEPVRVAGGTIARRLVNRLLNDVGDNPDQLPILQHVLMRMWDRREALGLHAAGANEPGVPAQPIDLDDYVAVGGMAEALSRHAEEAFDELSDRQKEIARRMFQCLTEKGADNREGRRPTRLQTIAEVAEQPVADVVDVVDVFREPGRSFLTPPAQVALTPEHFIDISHESLIRGWPRLRKWVDEESESADVYRRIAQTAELYAERKAALWQQPDLAIALAWRDKAQPNGAWAQRYHPGFDAAMTFLDASQAAHDAAVGAEERRRAAELRRARNTVYAVLGVLACVTALAGFAFLQKREADNYARIAESNERKAVAALRSADLAAQDLLAEARSARDQYRKANADIEDLASTVVERSSKLAGIGSRYQRSGALGKLGKYQDALGELDTILEIYPDKLSAIRSRIYEYLNLGRADDAIKEMQKVLAAVPESIDYANLALGEAYRRNYDAAIAAAGKGIDVYRPPYSSVDSVVSPDIERATHHSAIFTENSEFRIALGYQVAMFHAFKGDGEFASALDVADRANPDPSGAMNAYLAALNWAWQCSIWQERDADGGPIDYGLHAAEGALWERAAAIQPRYFDWARRAYEKFRDANRKRPEPRYEALSRFVAERLAQPRIGNAEPDIAAAPGIEELVLQANEVNGVRSGTSAMSIAAPVRILTTAIDLLDAQRKAAGPGRADLDDHLVQLLLRRADWRFDAGDPEGVRQDAQRVIAINPKVAEAYWRLGQSAVDDNTRLQNYEQAVRLDPKDTAALRDLARAIRGSDPQRALALLLRRRDFYAYADSYTYEEIARLQLEVGNKDDAMTTVRNAISINPARPELYELRQEIERAQDVSDGKRTIHLTAGYRQAGAAANRIGEDAKALSLYLRALKTIAPAANASDDDAKFELEASIRSLTELLSATNPPSVVRQFWQSLDNATLAKDVRTRIGQEVSRLGTQ
jgi:tetratricopeptide (TPR) repeat protein